MNGRSRIGRWQKPPLASAARSRTAIIAAAGLALLAAACGGSPGNRVAQPVLTTTQKSRSPSTGSGGVYLSFAKCMRSHGVTDFPDPVTGTGGQPGFRLQGGSNTDLNANNPAFKRGVDACQHILGHEFKFTFGLGGVGKGS
jgi:hypothetical protein